MRTYINNKATQQLKKTFFYKFQAYKMCIISILLLKSDIEIVTLSYPFRIRNTLYSFHHD